MACLDFPRHQEALQQLLLTSISLKQPSKRKSFKALDAFNPRLIHISRPITQTVHLDASLLFLNFQS